MSSAWEPSAGTISERTNDIMKLSTMMTPKSCWKKSPSCHRLQVALACPHGDRRDSRACFSLAASASSFIVLTCSCVRTCACTCWYMHVGMSHCTRKRAGEPSL